MSLEKLDLALTYFKEAQMYRWYESEVKTALTKVCGSDKYADLFKGKNLMYRDEILAELNKEKSRLDGSLAAAN